MRVGIIAAMPGELKPLVRGWQKLPVDRGAGVAMWQQQRGEDDLIAVCAGMGAAAARRAFTAAEHAGSLDMVFSIGWAGALTADALPGQAYAPFEVIDAQTGERMHSIPGQYKHRLVTSTQVASEAEKRRLATTYEATLVDMEAATIARLAQMRDIPFYCVKAVSDDLTLHLPDINPFIDASGKLEMSRFLFHVAARPQYWWPLLRLGSNSAVAARALADFINSSFESMRFKNNQAELKGDIE